MLADVSIIVALIASNLHAQERGTVERLIYACELYLGKYESFVFTMKLVHLYRVLAVVHKVACLLYAPRTAERKELARILQGYLFLPLETADTIH